MAVRRAHPSESSYWTTGLGVSYYNSPFNKPYKSKINKLYGRTDVSLNGQVRENPVGCGFLDLFGRARLISLEERARLFLYYTKPRKDSFRYCWSMWKRGKHHIPNLGECLWILRF